MSQRKVVLTVSVTGSIGDRTQNPNLPVTPREIAESAMEAQKAGAAVAHIHVRDPETGKPSMALELYEEVVERIRAESDLIINLTSGAGGRFIPDDNDPVGPGPGSNLRLPEKRMAHVLKLKPEICSLDVGTMNFGPFVFVNCQGHVEAMAKMALEAGVKPEMEVFELGHIEIARHLLKKGLVKSPPLFQLCMGLRWGIPARPEYMIAMRDALPEGALWAGFAGAAGAFPMLAQAVLLGGNARIGFEDTLHVEKGKPASGNRELVEKAVSIIRALGAEPATSEEARQILQL
ncbi:MAG: 3-keto-5-aminohexanoate cleavage protein [Deltaproteobacteria bacterium]|nr:3-keto-5-aminohexanoate cleavage protein [Deltaproteobacteria bacterium]